MRNSVRSAYKRHPSPVIVDMTVDDWLSHMPECATPTTSMDPAFERWLLSEMRDRFVGRKMVTETLHHVQSFLDRVRSHMLEIDHTQYRFFRNHAYAAVNNPGYEEPGFTVQMVRFDHDCDKCHFVGYADFLTEDRATVHFDLYYCYKMTPTVIARFGDEGSDCNSGLALADEHPALRLARDRAQKLGLYRHVQEQ